jgi:PAS domain S-box-containing protein
LDPVRVLLIDDEPDELLLTKTNLSMIDSSLNMEVASSAGEALKLLEVNAFDCIVIDYKMPGMNGLEFCRKLRGEGVSTPIILYTGQGSEDVAEEAFAAGVDDYLKKEKSLATFTVLHRNIKSIVAKDRAEEELKRSEELYTSMTEGVAHHEIVRNVLGAPINYRIIDTNSAYERITGLNRKEIIGKLATEAYGTSEAPYLETYKKVAEMGGPVTFETYFLPMEKQFRVSVFSSHKNNFTTVFDDITERKKAERETQRLTNALNALNDINKVLSKAPDENTYMNEVCQAIVKDTSHRMVWVGFAEKDEAKTVRPVAYAGFDENYIQQMNITWAETERGRGPTGTAIRTGKVGVSRNMLTDPHFAPWRSEAIKRGYSASIVFPLRNAGIVFGAISIYSNDPDPWSNEEIELLQQVADDFSIGILSIRERDARLKVDEELRQSRERIQEYNNRLEQMVAERTAKLLRSEETLRGFMNSSDEAYAIYDSELKLLDINRTGLNRLPKDTQKEDLIGRKIFEVYPGIEHTPWYQAYLDVLRTGIIYHGEGRSVAILGDRLLSASAFMVGDGLGVVSRDITEQRRTEEKLQRAEKIYTVNRLGATVAHDLRGPLNVVAMSLEMMTKEPEMTPKMLELARTNSARALEMIEVFRAGTREVKVSKINVNLPELVKETVESVPIPPVVSLDIELDEAPQKAKLDPEITRRIVDNLVRNAVEAMPQGGKLTVKIRREGSEVVIEVHDTGIGITKETSKTLFEPLFTTKKGGLGLGLYFVKMATEAQGGKVNFTSMPGEGTTFKIALPITDA